ncbi:hypothetical protein HHI36_020298 [Cryptolaemus montrouzieri]|uniref:RWD domain-containing protein n=1 Tax=Cryptolaemus montrouzieri TaxID=559131 RepID=A0ABD2NB19_9CUCU
MNNEKQQAEEIEVLKSIYQKQWVKGFGSCAHRMEFSPNLKIYFELNPEYPSDGPPTYELFAPELTKEQKNKIHKEFKIIYEKNIGTSILFQWIEKLKEIACTKGQKNKQFKDTRKSNKITSPKEDSKVDLRKKISKEIVHGPIIEDRKSVFQGHACAIHSEAEARYFLDHLLENKKISQAKHNIYAYRTTKNSILLQDCNDDGENHASKRLLHLLQLLKLENVMVVVTRWYGGIHLGPDRFKHIVNAARQALDDGGFIR